MSYSRKIAKVLAEIGAPGLNLEIIEIGHLPLYDQGSDADPPDIFTAFRERIRAAGAVLFVTPEYNRSVPVALKNAIDIASRPYGHSAWNGKPGAVVSCSPGSIGAFGANHHLKQSLTYLNLITMPQPELHIGGVDKLLDDEGKLTNDGTRKLVQQFLDAFKGWIACSQR